jgi:uncharacterized membrane protein YtjA (UPF0391 family)
MWFLFWVAIVFFIVSILAYAMGSRGAAATAAGAGNAFLWVFLVIAVIALVAWLFTGRAFVWT